MSANSQALECILLGFYNSFLGVLVQAHRTQLLTFAHVELLIQEIAARPDIWISAKLCEQVLASLRS